MVTRRRFIKLGLGAGAQGLTPWGALVPAAGAAPGHAHPAGHPVARMLDPLSLYKFADPLPLPPVLEPVATYDGRPFYDVAMTQFRQKLHADLPPTTLWGYNGMYPGPTFEARVGRTVRVRWRNEIRANAFLIPGAYDPTLEGANHHEPQVKTVVHLHGANVPTTSDGLPEAWFAPGFAATGPAWTGEVYEYPNRQGPATLWYHDHAIGQTRLNVYAGLAGLYLLRGMEELDGRNGLPGGRYEIPLVIQDRIFDVDGSLLFPVRDPEQVPTDQNHPGPWVPEFFGNTILVNGKLWPYLEVEPRRYRLRMLNGSNARFYNLRFGAGLAFTQIGSDQGFLPRPVRGHALLLAPGERADVIVDFAGMRGNVLLTNDAKAPFPDGDAIDRGTAGQIMQFRISRRLAQADASGVQPPRPANALPDPSAQALARQARVTRHMALVEFLDDAGEPIVGLLNNRTGEDTTTARPRLGAVEVWNFINTTGDTHPVHLHLVRFQVLARQPFDAERYRRDWIGANGPGKGPQPISPLPYLTGAPMRPEPEETGLKDTVRVPPGQVTTIVVRFGDYPGTYPWHCHILDHEDNAMMQRFEVVGPHGAARQ